MTNIDFANYDDFVDICANLNYSHGIELTESEIASFETVGKLRDFLSERYSERYPTGCLTSPIFYSIRRALIQTGANRGHIKPNSILKSYLPQTKKGLHWQNLEREIGISLAALQVDDPFFYFACAGLLAVSALFLASGMSPITFSMAVAFICSTIGRICLMRSQSSLDYPLKTESIRDMAESLVIHQFDSAARKYARWNMEDLTMSIQEIFAYHLQLDTCNIRMESKFSELI